MIIRAIENCLHNAGVKGWDKTYWAFDIHGTIMKPNYKTNEITREFYPFAKEAMQLISKRKDIVRILYTCSYPDEIAQYLEYFKAHDIHFDYINKNPEISDGAYGHYVHKFYFNVLMEDKAGFDPLVDWKLIYELFLEEK